MLLAGDLGGTKTNLAIVDPARGPREPVVEGTLPSGEFPSLEALIAEFLKEKRVRLRSASLGVAGPVVGGAAKITNLPWVIREEDLVRTFGLRRAHLINDLEAIACAVPHLEAEDIQTISAGRPVSDGAIGVIAPGTGLGEAFLVCRRGQYLPQPSEGGHADFGPANALQRELLEYLQADGTHVSNERVCSGLGIPNLYRFFKHQGTPEPGWLATRLSTAQDPTPVIVNAALQEDPPEITARTLELFVDILAQEAGNLALRVLATGGVYLAGGIPPRLLSVLTPERVLPIFRNKGRLAQLMDNIPLHVIINPKTALFGAAYADLDERLQ
ncbi:MAG: glucokinase [Dehalococcoidia bacterium]